MALLCGLLFVAGLFDYRIHKIPNLIPLMLLIAGLIRYGACGSVGELTRFAVTIIIVIVVLYPIFKIGGVGAGDVKLFGVSAGFFPTDKVIVFLFVAFLIGGIIALLRMILWRDARERLEYCVRYFADVCRTGKWTLYKQWNGEYNTGICLAGPLFLSAVLYWGGLY